MKGHESLNDYFVNILDTTDSIRMADKDLIPGLEAPVKQKFVMGVYGVTLKRELKMVVDENKN